MKNIFLSVNDVGVIIKNNFSKPFIEWTVYLRELILSTKISDFLSFYTIFHFRDGTIKVETSGNDFINGTRIRLHIEYFKKSLKISIGSSDTVYFLSS